MLWIFIKKNPKLHIKSCIVGIHQNSLIEMILRNIHNVSLGRELMDSVCNHSL